MPPVPRAPLPHSVGPLPRRGDTSHSAPESARNRNYISAYTALDHLYGEYVDEPGLSGDNSVGHRSVRLPSWSREEDYDADKEGEEKEKEERKGQEEEETAKRKRKEDGSKRKQAEDTRQGFQGWDSIGSYYQQRNSFLFSSRLTFTFEDFFGHVYSDGLSTTKPISATLLQRAPLPDDSVPHSESIQKRLCRLDELDLSESCILILEKIHQEMWAELPTIRFIEWDDLP